MAIDRQRIEKRDFPLAAQGYVREAVDAHLAAIADDVSAGAAAKPVTLAETAAARVRTIVGQAEARGAEIARQAELAAAQRQADTEREQGRVREEAVQRTRLEVRDVASTLEKIVLGLDEAERDVRSVIALLREQARGLAGELALVDREMDRAYEAMRPGGAPEPEPEEEEEAPSDDAEAASTDGAAEAGSGNGAEAKSESKQAAGDAPRAGRRGCHRHRHRLRRGRGVGASGGGRGAGVGRLGGRRAAVQAPLAICAAQRTEAVFTRRTLRPLWLGLSSSSRDTSM